MIQNLAALSVAAYGVYLFVSGQYGDGLTPNDLIKSGVASFGGLGYLAFNNLGSVAGWFKSLGTIKLSPDPTNSVYEPLTAEQKDFECLVHLRNRVVQAGSEEGVKVCAELNRIIFELNTGVKK